MDSNTMWATLFVEALAKSGLRTAVISPGSRSTPLTLAFAAHPRIDVYSILDERGAAFFGLGTALSSKTPAALVCTSGTAAANFFPAVMEANRAHVPLLLLTADRPHDVRSSGANQSVDQLKLFGSHVRWFEDVAPPEDDPQERTVRYIRTLAARAVATALGAIPGPVHLNFTFRKPLEPSTSTAGLPSTLHVSTQSPTRSAEFTTVQRGSVTISKETLAHLESVVHQTRRGLLVCGPRCPGAGFPDAVHRLAQVTGYPILADALSGVRFCSGRPDERRHVLGGYEIFLSSYDPEPDLILRFGGLPVSRNLQRLLETTRATQTLIAAHGVWEDPAHRLGHWLCSDEEVVCRELSELLTPPDNPYIEEVEVADAAAWKALSKLEEDHLLEGAVLPALVDSLPAGCNLVVGNSLPVRHLDHFVPPQQKPLSIYCNRGASGIDGTVATANGVAAASSAPMVLVLGDVALYHDLNSLLIFQRCSISGTVVVINNNGGGIFRSLPVASYDPPFTELFLTPHGLRFKHAADMFDMDYREANSRSALTQALTVAIDAPHTTLIEVVTDSAHHEEIGEQIHNVFQHQYNRDG